MTYPLIIRPEAEQDMGEGRDWYEGRRDGLGAEFLTAVDEVFNRIRDTPELFAPERRAIVMVLEEPAAVPGEAALLAEAALALDWSRPEEDAAWSYLLPGK